MSKSPKKLKQVFLFPLFIFSFLLIFPSLLFAQNQNSLCLVYFTGVGCPHCARTDPVVLGSLLKKYPNLIIIEYEIYSEQRNAPLLYDYNQKYQSGLGIPLIIFNKDNYIIGDRPILEKIEKNLKLFSSNSCPLLEKEQSFSEVNLNSLPGFPKIWHQEKILIKTKENSNLPAKILQDLILKNDLSEVLKGIKFEMVEPKSVSLSGRKVFFKKAIKLNGWLFQWNEEKVKIPSLPSNIKETPLPKESPLHSPDKTDNLGKAARQKNSLTLAKIFSLALADSINPCALAVLVLVLISVLTLNPGNKRKVFLSGISFLISIFLIYFFYGLVIVRFFQVVQLLSFFKFYFYKILAILAILLGILHLKDFFSYHPAGFLTEMPLSFRPKVREFILGISSPKGAFFAGGFVSLFLLPCTIGPYIICGGILCPLGIAKSLPYLLFYNLIFILPMIAVVLIVCFGLVEAKRILKEKDKNIRYIHLFAGIIILLLGILMLFGWI